MPEAALEDEPVAMDPASAQRFIWGTSINIQDSIHMFKDFLVNFAMIHRIKVLRAKELSIELDDLVDADLTYTEDDLVPYYPEHLRKVCKQSSISFSGYCH
jgi:DNA replication licensing factor MCM4